MYSLLHLKRARIFAALFLLAGCSGEDANRNPDVAAKVNNTEISVHEVSRVLGSEGWPGEWQGVQEGSEALEWLIDQELIVQKARQRHLERDPEVARELEASRREILVRAYLDRVVGPASPPSEDEIQAFYEANPALFKERRIYELQEIVVQLEQEQFEALEAVLSESRSLEEVLGWLGTRGIAFQTTKVVRAAEQLPFERLDDFSGMRSGQIALARTASGAQMIHLVSARHEPLSLAQAQPLIEEYLMNDEMMKVARAELVRLRGAARILYGRDFTQEARAQGGGSAVGTPAAATDRAANEPIQAAFERGVAGLR